MAKNAWPTGAEVLACITDIPDVTPPDVSVCTDIVDAVIGEFEDRTGRNPFLCDGTTTTRVFDPPDGRDRRLTLDVCCASVSTVTIGVFGGSPGQIMTLGTDYLLEDPNAAAKGKPVERIRFLRDPGHYPQSVTVAAQWGYGLTIPYDAWLGVLHGATVIGVLRKLGLSGPVKMFKQGSLERQYGIRGQKTTLEDYQDEYEAMVAKYMAVESH